MKKYLLLCSVGAILFSSCEKDDDAIFQIYSASGNIQPKIEEFRQVLGSLNTTPGATTGRREINWDGVPDSLLNKKLPDRFFNQVGANAPASLQRGLLYNGDGFQVSNIQFSHVNSEAATGFQSFSGGKTFANINESLWPVQFEVAGQTTPATVSAFGIVFSDVDKEGTVILTFFEDNKIIGEFEVPAKSGEGNFSFLGVKFLNRKITSVFVKHEGKLINGEKDVSQGGTKDLIVMDDFIYSEPVKR